MSVGAFPSFSGRVPSPRMAVPSLHVAVLSPHVAVPSPTRGMFPIVCHQTPRCCPRRLVPRAADRRPVCRVRHSEAGRWPRGRSVHTFLRTLVLLSGCPPGAQALPHGPRGAGPSRLPCWCRWPEARWAASATPSAGQCPGRGGFLRLRIHCMFSRVLALVRVKVTQLTMMPGSCRRLCQP